MISHEQSPAVRNELAAAIRQVNAAAVGAPELPELKAAWLRLDRSLSLAVVAGDDIAARKAVQDYRHQALAALAEVSR